MPMCDCLCTWPLRCIVWWPIHGRSARQRPLRIVYLDLGLTPSTRTVVTHTDVRSHVKCLWFKLRERQAWDGELKNSFINRTILSPHLCGGDWLSNWLQESSGSPARLAATGHWHNKHPGPYPDLDLDLGPRLITAPHVNTCVAHADRVRERYSLFYVGNGKGVAYFSKRMTRIRILYCLMKRQTVKTTCKELWKYSQRMLFSVT